MSRKRAKVERLTRLLAAVSEHLRPLPEFDWEKQAAERDALLADIDRELGIERRPVDVSQKVAVAMLDRVKRDGCCAAGAEFDAACESATKAAGPVSPDVIEPAFVVVCTITDGMTHVSAGPRGTLPRDIDRAVHSHLYVIRQLVKRYGF